MIQCKDCKLYKQRCSYSSYDENSPCGMEIEFNKLIAFRDKINARDRGKVQYMCYDDPDDIIPCLYGDVDELDCDYLSAGGDPKECTSARLIDNRTELSKLINNIYEEEKTIKQE